MGLLESVTKLFQPENFVRKPIHQSSLLNDVSDVGLTKKTNLQQEVSGFFKQSTDSQLLEKEETEAISLEKHTQDNLVGKQVVDAQDRMIDKLGKFDQRLYELKKLPKEQINKEIPSCWKQLYRIEFELETLVEKHSWHFWEAFDYLEEICGDVYLFGDLKDREHKAHVGYTLHCNLPKELEGTPFQAAFQKRSRNPFLWKDSNTSFPSLQFCSKEFSTVNQLIQQYGGEKLKKEGYPLSFYMYSTADIQSFKKGLMKAGIKEIHLGKLSPGCSLERFQQELALSSYKGVSITKMPSIEDCVIERKGYCVGFSSKQFSIVNKVAKPYVGICHNRPMPEVRIKPLGLTEPKETKPSIDQKVEQLKEAMTKEGEAAGMGKAKEVSCDRER